MSSPSLFVDRDDWTVDLRQLLEEAIPLAVLVGLVAILTAVPLALSAVGVLPLLFVIVSQFVLAVGAGIVLLYVVARGIQLADQ